MRRLRRGSAADGGRERQVAVVTGASGGIGRAVARRLAARGDRVALIARGDAGLEGAADDVRRLGGQPLCLPADVARWEEVRDAAARVERELGPVGLWVNDAFTSVFARFDDIDPEEYRRVTEVSYLGYVYGTRAALELMRPRDTGTIVHVGSALAYRGIPLQTAYCGAKHAIQGFHEALRCELLHEGSGIHVTMVQMPAVNTPQFTWVRSKLPRAAQPVPPIYQPDIAARAVEYAADHPRRREYWVGASTAATLAANAIAPGLLDRYLARTGFASQQTDQPAHHGPGNLWSPADGPHGHDYGAHGAFDDRSVERSPQLWASQHHAVLAAVGAGALTAALGLTAVRSRSAPG
jgi:NAD(P)-dependent dehydrogenase (short-subunit alcohol dehydrogenase family)